MPRIVSFAWTTPALLADGPLQKTCTRREWSENYVRHVIAEVDRGVEFWWAYDRNPRVKGKAVARIRPVSIEYQNTRDMTEVDYRDEGFEWFDHEASPEVRRAALASLGVSLLAGVTYTPTLRGLFDVWRASAQNMWVVRFERLEVL